MTISEIINTPWVILIPVEHIYYSELQFKKYWGTWEHKKMIMIYYLGSQSGGWQCGHCGTLAPVRSTLRLSYRFLIVPLPLYTVVIDCFYSGYCVCTLNYEVTVTVHHHMPNTPANPKRWSKVFAVPSSDNSQPLILCVCLRKPYSCLGSQFTSYL